MLLRRPPVSATHAPYSIMSTETLASCAETRQNGAAKISAVNKTPFIMRQIRAPLTRSPKNRFLVGPPIGQYHGPCETADFWRSGKVRPDLDRKTTPLNSSHLGISYAVFFFKKNYNN